MNACAPCPRSRPSSGSAAPWLVVAIAGAALAAAMLACAFAVETCELAARPAGLLLGRAL